MNIHRQDLTALQNSGTDHAANFRRLDGELLVRTLGIHLKGLDPTLFNDVHHVFHSRIPDLIHNLLRTAFFDVDFHSRADGSYAEDLGDCLQSHLFFQFQRSADEDQTFISLYFDSVADLFQRTADPIHQHAFKIGLVHPFQRYFAAAHDICLLFHSHFPRYLFLPRPIIFVRRRMESTAVFSSFSA